MSNQSDLLTSDIKSLETQIESKMIGLNKETDTSKLSEYKKEISEAITKKSNIAGDLSPQGSYLKQLIFHI